MFLVKLALRNLTRHKRRTLLTASVIALGVMFYIIFDSLLVGMNELSFANIINLESGHLQVSRAEYWEEREEMPLDSLFVLDSNLMKKIKQVPHFKAMVPRIKFTSNLTNGIEELPVITIGIDSQGIKKVYTIDEYLVEGSMFSEGEYEAVLGWELARLMELNVGDYFTLLLKTRDGAFNTIDAVVKGLVNSPDPMINNSVVYVPLDIARRALNIGDQVGEVIIRLENREYASAAASDLNKTFSEVYKGLSAHSWKDAAGSVIAMSKAQQAESQVTIGILLILAAVGIINTIILAALERMEELGMMKALGMKEREIIIAFMLESLGISIIGGILGCIFGAVGVYFQAEIGYDLAWFGLENIDFGLPINRFYGAWHTFGFVFGFAYGAVISLLVSYLPARWAAKKDPVKAIYHR